MIFASPLRASAAALLGGLLLAACNGNVVTEDSAAGGGGADTGTTSTTSTTSTTATATNTASGGAGGLAECVPQSGGAGGWEEPTCDDLDVMIVSNPVIADADGDGQVQAGETATLQVDLSEIAGLGFSYYPGVAFESTDEGVTVSSNDWLYAILPCQSYPMSASVQIAADLPPGTVVTVTARVAMINGGCLDAYSIDVPITVH